jgi:hypothetical protein
MSRLLPDEEPSDGLGTIYGERPERRPKPVPAPEPSASPQYDDETAADLQQVSGCEEEEKTFHLSGLFPISTAWVTYDPSLNSTDRDVFIHLHAHASNKVFRSRGKPVKTFVSNAAIAREMSVGVRTVRRSMSKLVKRGHIARQLRPYQTPITTLFAKPKNKFTIEEILAHKVKTNLNRKVKFVE